MTIVSASLALPMMAMMLLTLVVWLVMFVHRVGYANANGIDAQKMKTPSDVARLLPDEVSGSGNNFKNLFEIPVLFYVMCLYLSVFGQVSSLMVTCAWAFVALRAVHSFIHCSYNNVMHRFIAYLASSVALWVMVVVAVINAL
ncbi:MAG: MAPEG family protein [Halioglobus sp.]